MRKTTAASLLAAAIAAASPVAGMASAGSKDIVNGDDVPDIPGAGDLIGSLVWVIVCLAIVVVLIVWVIKWLSARNRQWGANRSIRSLGGVALGQNSSVQVIEIAGRIYVVGVGETITLLDKLDDPEQVDVVIAALEQQTGAVWSPKDLVAALGKWRQRDGSSREPRNEQWSEPSSFSQMLQSKMEDQAERKGQLQSLLREHKTNERLMDDEK